MARAADDRITLRSVPLSSLFSDPMLRKAFRLAEESGLDASVTFALPPDRPPSLDAGAAETPEREPEHEDAEGDELDRLEVADLELTGESDCEGIGSGTVDDEPSLGSLDSSVEEALICRPLSKNLENDPMQGRQGLQQSPVPSRGSGARLCTWLCTLVSKMVLKHERNILLSC